jgi:hypothetical protein
MRDGERRAAAGHDGGSTDRSVGAFQGFHENPHRHPGQHDQRHLDQKGRRRQQSPRFADEQQYAGNGVDGEAEPREAEQFVEAGERKVLRIAEHTGAEHDRYADHDGHADGMDAKHDRMAPIGLAQPGRKVRLLEPGQEFHAASAFISR